MSTPDQEARALERARVLLLALSSGEHPARPIRDLRAEARDIAKHYPLLVGERWIAPNNDNQGVMMSLAADYEQAKERPKRRRTRIDEIYEAMSPADRETFLAMLADIDLSQRAVATILTKNGYPVSATPIGDARRDGWEPA